MKLNIGENLRKLRREKDLTQEQLAEILGVTFQSVSRWETGATYPDIELLPVMAELFGVSMERLLGVEKERLRQAPQECYDQLNALVDDEEILSLLKKLHREYPLDEIILWKLCYHTKDLEEQRRLTEKLLEISTTEYYRESVIGLLINAEDEGRLQSFLDKYTASFNLSRELRLEERYHYRKEWDKFEEQKQQNLHTGIFQLLLPRLVKNYPKELNVKNSLQASKTRLALVDILSGTEGYGNPVSGDKIPDLWFGERIQSGMRLSCQLAESGQMEQSLLALEDLTELYEKFWNLPDGTRLTYRCPALDRFEGILSSSMLCGPEAGPRFNVAHSARIIRSAETSPSFYHVFWSHYDILPLDPENGWVWFENIRKEERYKKCLNKMRSFIIEKETHS
ncbi:MAG: helix-turn-helix transcriptional regulator [Clostridia bacterium]|nr:helix-turn-helix transcriptional regulator [Clostridia bacterium]